MTLAERKYWRTMSTVMDVNFCFQLFLLAVWPSVFKATNLAFAFAMSAYFQYKLAKAQEADLE